MLEITTLKTFPLLFPLLGFVVLLRSGAEERGEEGEAAEEQRQENPINSSCMRGYQWPCRCVKFHYRVLPLWTAGSRGACRQAHTWAASNRKYLGLIEAWMRCAASTLYTTLLSYVCPSSCFLLGAAYPSLHFWKPWQRHQNSRMQIVHHCDWMVEA